MLHACHLYRHIQKQFDEWHRDNFASVVDATCRDMLSKYYNKQIKDSYQTLRESSKDLHRSVFQTRTTLSLNVHLPILLSPKARLICAYQREFFRLGSSGLARLVWTQVISIFLTRPICVRLLISPSIPHQSQSPQ